MKKESVSSEIGFSDSELVEYGKRSDRFTVELLAWNESSISIVFRDVIRILDNDANSISAFFKVSDSEFLKAALHRLYDGTVAENHSYVHYQLLDDDDIPALEVVCAQMSISYAS